MALNELSSVKRLLERASSNEGTPGGLPLIQTESDPEKKLTNVVIFGDQQDTRRIPGRLTLYQHVDITGRPKKDEDARWKVEGVSIRDQRAKKDIAAKTIGEIFDSYNIGGYSKIMFGESVIFKFETQKQQIIFSLDSAEPLGGVVQVQPMEKM